MSWLFAVFLAIAMAVVAVWPTYFWLRFLHVPAFIAGVFSPALTAFVVFVLGIVYGKLGVFWSGARVFPVLFVVGMAGFLLFRRSSLRRNSQENQGFDVKSRPVLLAPTFAPKWSIWFWLSVLVGWLLAALPMMLSAEATYPVQQWDPSFHMNGIWSINHEGNAEFGTALGANYASGNSANYPIGWHIFTALFSVPTTVVLTANASTLALILLWLVGGAAYTRMLFPSRIAWSVAPIIGAGMLSMPADALMAYSQWPNAAALALLPGIAALALLLGRKVVALLAARNDNPVIAADYLIVSGRAGWWRLWIRYVLWIILLASAVVGAIVVHPSVAFNLLVLLLPAVLAGALRLWRKALRQRRLFASVFWPMIVISGIVSLVIIYQLPTIQNMGDYPRSGSSWLVALGNFLTPSPPYAVSFSLVAWISAIAVLMLFGLVVILVSRRVAKLRKRGLVVAEERRTVSERVFEAISTLVPVSKTALKVWPVWSFLAFGYLVLVAYGPDSTFREVLIAPWYLDARRLMEPQNLTMIPIAALGLAAVIDKMSSLSWLQVGKTVTRQTSVAVGCVFAFLLVTGGAGMQARISAAQGVYDPDKLGKPGMATSGELAMIFTLEQVLPDDAVVLGDPKNGSVYVQMIAQRRVVFPQLSLSAHPSESEEILTQSFNQIHTNPQVCEVIRQEGITHFYEDADGMYYSTLRSKRAPGLYNVDTSTGFELVAEGDDARVYRITACD